MGLAGLIGTTRCLNLDLCDLLMAMMGGVAEISCIDQRSSWWDHVQCAESLSGSIVQSVIALSLHDGNELSRSRLLLCLIFLTVNQLLIQVHNSPCSWRSFSYASCDNGQSTSC